MASDIFLKIDAIPGESTDSKHAKWIEVMSFSSGASQSSAGQRSTGGAASRGRVTMQDVTWVHQTDAASPGLFLHCCNGTHIPKMTFEFCRATGDKAKYLECVLEDVMISSVATGAGGEDIPTETVALNFGKIQWTYIPTDHKSGVAGSAIVKWWSNIENKGG